MVLARRSPTRWWAAPSRPREGDFDHAVDDPDRVVAETADADESARLRSEEHTSELQSLS